MSEKRRHITLSRAHIHLPPDTGAKIADSVAGAVGSWRFIILQSACLLFWIVFNSLSFTFHWDGPPFILLNLMLSFQAAFTGPFVMMAQNRQATKDRLRDDLEAKEVSDLYNNHQLLLDINRQQLEILSKLEGNNAR